MKIELKINADESVFLNSRLFLMQDISVIEFKKLENTQKSLHSIWMDLSDIIFKKNKSILRKDSLFDQDKTYKVSLKYHEAQALYVFIKSQEGIETDDFKKMLIRKLTTQLDQKLKQ